MKARVLKKFRDKYTGKVYEPGTVLTVSRKRFGEIVKALGPGWIEAVPEDKG